ncbi:hypothetical protein [Microcoleus sp. Pol12A5]|uniref:hypothetical protein n=1 Tax=Microcoleus sp. Pol12A5 TaxID=3055392 RepID=UPI002FD59F2D
MEVAISMFLAEEITATDERLNYLSYEELSLICPHRECRELVFHKPCIEGKRVPHFSHFKDTGKNCKLERKGNTHSGEPSKDSESREQSLEKFQTKFKDILDQAIINNPNQTISSINELKECRLQGLSLVDTHKIDIPSWLSWFKKERKLIEKIALSLIKNNNELSKIQGRVLTYIVDYLCVPASEYILEDILYYVFYLLNKNVSVNNDSQEVCSKVIELILYVSRSLTFDEFPSEAIGKHEILNFGKTLGEIGTKLEKEHQRIINEPERGFGFNKFGLYRPFGYESCKETELEYISGKRKQNKKGKIRYVKSKGKSPQKLSICWETDGSEQHLIFKHNSVIVATFSKLNNDSLQWKPLSGFNKLSRQIAIPTWYNYDPILSTSLEQFFLQWLVSQGFAEHLSLCSRRRAYSPALVKLLLLYMSYAAEQTEISTETELLGSDMQLSLDKVGETYKNLISGLVQDTPHMKRIYELDETFALQAVKPTE